MAHRKLGKYEISERLGRGGMAEVYRAYHANLDRFVAIKVLHAFLADDPEFKNRFEKEARNIARLRHTNIVQVYDFDYDDDSESYYMVMELVEGATLKERLFKLSEQGKLLALASAVRVIREAASALAYAHSQNMVHRDVKPGNLMLDRDGRVVLTDFGIAKIVTGAQFTSTGGMVGTPAYMAPEQGLGEPGDERADLYSLGVIFFQLVTGRLPYDAETPLAVILKHLNEPIPSPRDYRPDLPVEIEAVIMRLMSKDPNTRYQNANELIVALDALEQALDLSAIEGGAANTALLSGERLTPTTGRLLTPAVRTTTQALQVTETPLQPKAAPASSNTRSGLTWLLAGMAVLVVVIALYALAANQGLVPAIGLLPSNTPTVDPSSISAMTDEATLVDALPATEDVTASVEPSPTDEPTATGEPTETDTPTPSATPTVTLTATASPTTEPPTAIVALSTTAAPSATASRTATQTPSQTLTRTPTSTATAILTPSRTATRAPSPTASRTSTPRPTPTSTATPTASAIPLLDVTQTLVQATLIVENRQATMRACDFNYRIVDQVPADGEFFPTNSVYVREITLRNTGTCTWERNTSLNFVSGESFSAGPRIFIREPVPVGTEVILRFEGRTPIRGGNLSGTWELRTPELIQIGEPISIGIFAYTR